MDLELGETKVIDESSIGKLEKVGNKIRIIRADKTDDVDDLLVIIGKIKTKITQNESKLHDLTKAVDKLRISDSYDTIPKIKTELLTMKDELTSLKDQLIVVKNYVPKNPDYKFEAFKTTHYLAQSQKLSVVLKGVIDLLDSLTTFLNNDKLLDNSKFINNDDDCMFDNNSQSNDLQKFSQKQKKQLNLDKDRAINGFIYAKEMNEELKDLERSICELHQMFIEVANQVEVQQELLSLSEMSVIESKKHSEKALKVLIDAEKHVNSARKKFLYAIITILLVVGLVVGVVVGGITIFVMLGGA